MLDGDDLAVLRELADRMRIQDVLHREARAIDVRDWALWRTCYTEDADIDWTGNDAIRGRPDELGPWLAKVSENFPPPSYQHFVTNFEVTLNGDRATSRVLQLIPVALLGEQGRQMAFCGIWFDDEWVRQKGQWKICKRTEHLAWRHNFPAGYQTPSAS